jgi:NTE family protein
MPIAPPCLRRLALAVLMLAGAGCSVVDSPMNQPLAAGADGRPDMQHNYGLNLFARQQPDGSLAWQRHGGDLLVFVAFSGGGKRSSAFGHGALRGLRAIPTRLADGRPGTLLDDVDYLSGVSGGSFPAAHYGLHRERSFETFEREFLKVDVDAYLYGVYLLPWNWDWLVNPRRGTNDYMAAVYDRLMFRGATFADLQRRGAPLISINATDVANEVTFPFLNASFGLICSDLNAFPIARAVAASNGFPILLSPVTIRSYAERCSGLRPSTAPPASWAEPHSAISRRAEMARIANRYADPAVTRYIHLMDGGIADNLALRGVLAFFVTMGSTDDAVIRHLALQTRRILVLSVDGQAAPDPRLGLQPMLSGIGQVFTAVSGTQIDSYNFETLMLMQQRVRELARHFAGIRCRNGRIIDGKPCDDVQGELVHVSLSGIDDPVMRARLEAIPTGLTIPDADVDALVAYGERIVRDHPVLRRLAAEAGTGEGRVEAPSAPLAPPRRGARPLQAAR